MKKILVTGANGFVGSNIFKVLLDEGVPVRGLVRETSNLFNLRDLDAELLRGDLRDYDSLLEALEGCDGLIHTAALYRFWAPDSDLFYRINVEGTQNILEAAYEKGVEKAVVTSTASYLDFSGGEASLPPLDSLESDYKKTKCQAEKKALEFGKEKDFPVVVVSPTVPLGPGDIGPTPTGRMIRDFLRGKMNGYLDMSFNAVDVKDVARGHLEALREGEPGRRYILGYRNTSLREIMELLSEFTGKSVPRFRSPYSMALAAAWVDELVEGEMLGRHPTVPIQAVYSTRRDESIERENLAWDLSPPSKALVESLRRSMDWFCEYDDELGGEA